MSDSEANAGNETGKAEVKSCCSSEVFPNILLVGFACFVVGFFLADALSVDLIGGVSPTSTSIPSVTTSVPSVTTTVPSAVAMNVLVVNDDRCLECVSGMQALLVQLETLFPDMDVESFDYSSAEGQDLFEQLDLQYLPAILFDDSVKDAANYANIASYLEQKGSYLSLRIGANFDPTAEICDNGIDDTGDGKVDCDDEACASKLICNEDAVAECAAAYSLSPETVIFFHSDSCGWCARMKPGVEQLQEEGYSFYWVEVSDSEAMQVIENCVQEYMTSSGVPQFICVGSGEIHVGAFADADANLDLDALRAYADGCKAA